MTTYERRQSVMELLRKQPGLRVPELATALVVSEGTVRNDLNALESEGRVTRVHGGAIVKDQSGFQNLSFNVRHQEHATEKLLIAKYASELVNDGDSILLDASSTIYYLALAIQERNRLRVVTNGLDVARLLAKNPSNTVIVIGGILNQEGSSVTGLFSETAIQELHIQKAFVSSSGFSLERGMTEVHIEEAQLKRKVIESSQEVIALIDSSKIGKEDLTPFARVEQINHLITDSGISPMWAQLVERAGIKLTICQGKP
ncbi:MAG: DeoR/GlpR family DNA-binding transcription regulator [Chloroflexi bacterium]|nr:DeoR/GlpR family DNA-binding transcription regulator [Chloroflexota bacterium]